MPKEQGERTPRMGSKNAKDRSNSATLLAARAKAQAEQEANGRGSRCSSEKDSGYSDTGSDSLQTDEDQHSTVRQPKVRAPHLGSHQENTMLISGAPELTPIFIIKNVVLKQPVQAGQEQLLQAPLTWGATGNNIQGPTHVLLLPQPEVSPQAPVHILKPQPRRADGGSKKSKATYLPILNSYPRIAPHPSKKVEKTNSGSGSGGGSSNSSSCSSSISGSSGGGGGVGTAEDHCQSKRVCTEEKREEVSTTSQLPKQHVHKQPEGRIHSHSHSSSSSSLPTRVRELPPHVRRSPHPPSSPSTSASLGSPSVSSTETPSPSSSSELAAPPPRSSRGQRHQNHQHQKQNQGGRPSGSVRHRRFLNTVEILSQSGLLDITLRTQELLRQSAATEREIAQLRHHTQLLCQAAQACPSSPDAWNRVHQAMAESGHYPSLKELDGQCHQNGGGGGSGGGSCNGSSHSSSPVQVQAEADTSSGGGGGGDGGGSGSSAKEDVVVSLVFNHNHHEEMAPPSPLLAPMDDLPLDLPTFVHNGHADSPPGQSRGPGTDGKPLDDLLMPPDSSTHSPLL